jgi:outer membrane protein insertion porin family
MGMVLWAGLGQADPTRYPDTDRKLPPETPVSTYPKKEPAKKPRISKPAGPQNRGSLPPPPSKGTPAHEVAESPEEDSLEDTLPLQYRLEGIQIRGNRRTRDRVILRYIKFRAGMMLDVDDPEIDLTRYRLLGTGFFRTVSLSLKKGSKRGAVLLVIDVKERNTIVVNDVWMGLSATADDQGNARPLSAYAGADIAENNLAGTGMTLGGAVALAEKQLALRIRFFDPAFLGTTWMAQTTLFYNIAREFYGNKEVRYDDPNGGRERVQDFAIVSYKRFGGSVGTGHDLSLTTQFWLDYTLEGVDAGLPQAASHRVGLDIQPLEYHLKAGRSVLSTVRAAVSHDSRDSPFLPVRGWFASIVGDMGLSPLGSSYDYQKIQMRASHWWQLPWQHVMRLELFGGAISGNAPIYEQFYIGDYSDLLPDRILGLNTDRRPAPNLFQTQIREVRYGEYAAKVQGEYRIPLYRGSRSVYGIDLFSALGLYAVATKRDLDNPPRGYSGAARIPIDMTFNLGLRMDTQAGGFAFAFSNLFGFIPLLQGSR